MIAAKETSSGSKIDGEMCTEIEQDTWIIFYGNEKRI
jgi:hypothetical protein